MIDHNFAYPGHFSKLCSVSADLSNMPLETLPKRNGVEGEFYRARYEVVLLFNSAELKACIKWEENGVEKRWVYQQQRRRRSDLSA